jgi:hypothetical protein
MSRRHYISIMAVVVLALGAARAQDNSGQPPASGNAPDSSQPQQQEQESTTPPTTPAPPVPAYGQTNAVPIDENPPISGLDEPALGPHAAPVSYLQPGATLSEAADSNVGNTLGGQNLRSVTRALGSLTLRRLWSNYKLAVDYAGGVGYYDAPGVGFKALQSLALDQKISWKRGQLSLRDDGSYLPEGNFAAAYGSLNPQEGAGGILGEGIFGGTVFGALGQVPRLMNVGAADISENLSPKSALTLAGGYGLVHFYGNDSELNGVPFLGSSEVTAQGGYDRILSPHNQVALIYGYQGFRFSATGTAFHTQVIQLAYGHRVSGRMDFTIGAGPQIVQLSVCTVQSGLCVYNTTVADVRVGVAGQFKLRYKFPRTSLELSYRRMDTNGSGFFAGAESDIARLQVSRPLSRVWSGFADLGFAKNSRINPEIGGGINANTYTFGFAGAGVHRMLGRNFHAFASYQFNELSFDRSFCGSAKGCSRISQRNVATIGLDWTPRPIRIE